MKAHIAVVGLLLALAASTLASLGQASASGALPVYPGAVPLSPQASGSTKVCGNTLTWKSYRSKDSLETVARWYQQHLPGSSRVELMSAGPRNATVIAAGGGQAAAIAALSYTNISLEQIDPPYTPNQIKLMARVGAHGDATAQAQANAQFHCGAGQ